MTWLKQGPLEELIVEAASSRKAGAVSILFSLSLAPSSTLPHSEQVLSKMPDSKMIVILQVCAALLNFQSS
jgi:hypothetical protein